MRQFRLESLFHQVLETLERDVGEEVVGQPRGEAVLNLHQVLTQPRPIIGNRVSNLDPNMDPHQKDTKHSQNLFISTII